MANKRMLSRRMSFSTRVPQMTVKSQLVYTWIIAWLDDYGCFTGDIEEIKSQVFGKNPRITEKDIEAALIEMIGLNLINLYQKDSDLFLQYTNFEKFQTFRSDRPRSSEYPKYSERDREWDTTGIPVGGSGLTKDKISKDKISSSSKEEEGGKPPGFGNVEINFLINLFKEKTGLKEIAEPLKDVRRWGWNLTRKYSMKQLEEEIDWLLGDTFWKDNLTKISQLWYQMPKFLRETETITREVKPK